MYTATNGNLYYVAGSALFYIDSNFNITQLGTLNAAPSTGLTTPVAMQDNGNVLVIVDGSTAGYAVNLQPGVSDPVNAFGQITDPNFLGSVGIGYVDTFLGFDQPGTRNFYTSL